MIITEKPESKATVVLLVDAFESIALARKKQPIHHGKEEIPYSLGMYNGYGGKQEPEDETIFDTAVRELKDESGVAAEASSIELVLRVYFYKKTDDGNYQPFMDVSFFFLRDWEGVPIAGDEMGPPTFFEREKIPYDEMMPADRFLFQLMFAGKKGVYEVRLNGKKSPPEIQELDEEL